MRQTSHKEGGAKTSRARELDDVRGKDGRIKSRGRVIKSESKPVDGEVRTPTTEQEEDEEVEGCKLLARMTFLVQIG